MATYLELKQQIADLQKEADALRTQERQGVIDRMKEAIAVYDITAQELGLGARGPKGTGVRATKKAAKTMATRRDERRAQYGDGKGNSWGGRGPRPKWLRDALAGGASLEDFAQH